MSRPARAGRLAVFAAAALLLAATTVHAEEPDCFERLEVVRYLHRLQDRVMDSWGLPPDSLANQEVVVRFGLAADGRVLDIGLVSSTSHRLARTVVYALATSAPFPPLPPEASCLVGRRISIAFQNPA